MAIASIGIGSNVGDAPANVERALRLLGSIGRLIAKSDLYSTKPWGVTDQADFCNAAAIIEVDMSPRELLKSVKSIEDLMGRTPTYRWGPRVIDLDILTFDDLIINEPDLVIPHPQMMQRAFVLAPLAQIDPSYEPSLAALPEQECNQVKRQPSPSLT